MAPLPTLMVSPLTVTVPGKRPCTLSKRKQMRVGLDRAEIVDADDLDVGAPGLGDGAQDVAADAAEPVDGYADCHLTSLPARSSSSHCVSMAANWTD